MMSQSKPVSNMQDALEVRLRIAQVSGQPKSAGTPHRNKQTAPARLFLVKGNSVQPSQFTIAPFRAIQPQQPRWKHRHPRSKPMRPVLRMPMKPDARVNDLLMTAMAAAGPLVWAGHALLTWMKIF